MISERPLAVQVSVEGSLRACSCTQALEITTIESKGSKTFQRKQGLPHRVL